MESSFKLEKKEMKKRKMFQNDTGKAKKNKAQQTEKLALEAK